MSAMAPSRAVDQLRTIVAADHAHELTAIARELAAVQSSGGTSALSGVAVLCRLRTQVSEVRRVLKDFGVPTRSHHQAGSSQAQDAFDVLAYFALCTRPGDDDAFDKAIAIPSRPGFAQGQAAHRYLQAAARTHRCSLLRAAQLAQQHSFPAVVHGGASCKLTKPQQSALTDFLGVVISLRNAAIGPQNGALGPLLKRLIHRVGLVDHLAKQKQSRQSRRRAFVVRVPGQPAEDSSSEGESDGEADTADAQHGQRSISRLLELAARVEGSIGGSHEARIAAFCDALALASHDAATDHGEASRNGAVFASTIHQAKGLEWETVYLPELVEGRMPLLPRGLQPNSLELVEHFEEERRLMYVAITRARRRLVLSWHRGAAPQTSSEPSAPSEPAKKSRFLNASIFD